MVSLKTTMELLAVQEVFCNMAVNDEFPLDLTQLDILEVHDKALELLNQDENYKKVCMIEKLSELTSYDTREEVEQALESLQEAEDNDKGDESADLYVTIWEPLENEFTVSELLEKITP